MKIGVDIRVLTDRYYSGVSEYADKLLQNLLKIDRDNDYRFYYNSARDLSGRLPKFDYPNVQIVKTNWPNKIFNYIFQKIFNRPYLDKLLGGVDVFFEPHFNFVSLSPQSRGLMTIHDLSFLRYPEFFNQRKNFWHNTLNINKLVGKFSSLVAVSQNTKRDIVDLLKFPEDKIKVIYSGVSDVYRPIDKGDPELEKVKIKYNLSDKFILYLGNIEPRKNLPSLIRAYNQFRQAYPDLADYQLVITGLSGWKVKETEDVYRNSPWQKDIKFIGYIQKQDKPILYNLAKVVAYPSLYEGFGFPPLEAMKCGTPVLCTNVSSLPEIVGDAALMIDPDNISAMAVGLRELIVNENLRAELISRGYRQSAKFSWEQTAREYLELFQSLDQKG